MKFEKTYRIGTHDTDVNGVITPSLVQRYMMETADQQMRERKPTYKDLLEENVALIVTRATVEIFKDVKVTDVVDVKTWNCTEGGMSLFRGFEMIKDGELCAKGFTTWAAVNTETKKLIRAKEVDLSNYEWDEKPEMGISTKFKLPKDVELAKVGEKKVLYGEVDVNLHMNNTYYADILWSYIPEIMNKRVKSFNIHYQKEAPLYGNIEIYMGKLDDKNYCFKTVIDGETNVTAMIEVEEI